ncbi:MAG: family 43 glycosylhydrolase [Bacteroidota bacterium]
MRKLIIFLALSFLLASCATDKQPTNDGITTFCNPLDLSYRFQLEEPSRREAADPTVTKFGDTYFLFASKSGGYWHTDDLKSWTFIETDEIPTEEYAPTAVTIGDTIYFLGSSNEKSTIYKSTDPLSGKWEVAVEELDMPVWDPAFYLDDDNRLYLYWGCSNDAPLFGVEIDYKHNFEFMTAPKALTYANPGDLGWEVPGDYNTRTKTAPWIEGPWVNKYKGKYYLQYAGPGTEFKSYADAVYVSDNPLGPFDLAEHNPFAYKPEGFAAGAGHGSTFTDKFGNYWHIGTVTISQKHVFERRLALYPTFFDDDDIMHATTRFGDYPHIIPDKRIADASEIFPGWMLLSYKKEVEVSSNIDSLPGINMVDEDIRTWWAAESGNSDEWASINLGNPCEVYAVQINFADQNTNTFGRQAGLSYKYVIESSTDGTTWEVLIDKSENTEDNSHDYTQLPEKVTCQYLRIKNISMADGHVALSGFRIFGNGKGAKPEAVTSLNVLRDPGDQRKVTLSWQPSENAIGYNISYGILDDKLYNNYLVYEDTSLVIRSLNAELPYYFTIESFNENGITAGNEPIFIQ